MISVNRMWSRRLWSRWWRSAVVVAGAWLLAYGLANFYGSGRFETGRFAFSFYHPLYVANGAALLAFGLLALRNEPRRPAPPE